VFLGVGILCENDVFYAGPETIDLSHVVGNSLGRSERDLLSCALWIVAESTLAVVTPVSRVDRNEILEGDK
jgi:hypothetical protein